jgi:hypothetical protein
MAGILALALAAPAAQAADFGPLMNVVHQTWPDKTHIGVVADYHASRGAIEALAEQAGPASTITVLNVTGEGQLERAGNLLASLVKPDYLVLLPEDRVVRDGSFGASQLVARAAWRGVPTIATTPAALHQGAVFAMGEKTGFQLLETDRLIGTVEVILPQKGHFMNNVADFHSGSARIALIGAL